ncbi:hypothetical protein EBX31_06435 [bacterium]|nr:hypothetical protein [bacterium]
MSLKTDIAAAILERLESVTALKSKTFDTVKLLASDFQDHELPAVQLIDLAETVEHEQRRAKKYWQIALEVVLKPNEFGTKSQRDLWDLCYEIERALWERPNLRIPGIIHLKHLGSQTDLHLLEPLFFARLDFEVIYYQPLVDEA